MKSVNPASGEVLATFETLTDAQVDEKLALAWAAFGEHRRIPLAERAAAMIRAAEILESEKEEFGRLMTMEMGKTLGAAIAEAEKCALGCRYYAEKAAEFLADQEVATNARKSFVRYEPIGPVLAVMPWNFPFWQLFRFAAPALMAGNVAVLKHASNVPQCAVTIEEIFRRAGFIEGAFQTLLIGSKQVARVLDDPRIRAVTLTGSNAAGAAVAAQAGDRIKKTVLELGGNDPFIIMPSADLDAAVATGVKSRTLNNGQSCVNAKRFIVHEQVYDEFERRFVAGMAALKVGDPMDPATDIGPLATESIRSEVEEQVRKSVEKGARLLTGGDRPIEPGNYFTPAVLTDIPTDSPAYTEEIFGPVASLFRVADLEEAIRIANDTPFGLGSSAWTNDDSERDVLIDRLDAGQVFVNGMVASDPRLPFGGTKESGYGRELAALGMHEFVNIKTVWIGEGPARSKTE